MLGGVGQQVLLFATTKPARRSPNERVAREKAPARPDLPRIIPRIGKHFHERTLDMASAGKGIKIVINAMDGRLTFLLRLRSEPQLSVVSVRCEFAGRRKAQIATD